MKIKIIFAILIVCMFISCEKGQKEAQKTDGPTKESSLKIEDLEHPIRIQYIERKGMNYMIISTPSSDGGVHVVNLTLDSVMVRRYELDLIEIDS